MDPSRLTKRSRFDFRFVSMQIKSGVTLPQCRLLISYWVVHGNMTVELFTTEDIISTSSSKEIISFCSNHCRHLKSENINDNGAELGKGEMKCKWLGFGGWKWNPSYGSKTHVDCAEKNLVGKLW
ncbi:unnamed protein product [Linum trigynum]|uniref:Uncharacterized protein n=1 Tax=Linum trigynum TaxID=586398 RepID=A0AAV2DEI0_9ROSI